MTGKITIESSNGEPRVTINDTEVACVKSVTTKCAKDEYPETLVRIDGSSVNYDGIANIDCYISTESITDAAKLLQFHLKLDSDFRNGMIASIQSALQETEDEDGYQLMTDRERAAHIMDRIFGLEN